VESLAGAGSPTPYKESDMATYAATVDFTATFQIEADSLEEAEAEAGQVDPTELLDHFGDATVVHVEREQALRQGSWRPYV